MRANTLAQIPEKEDPVSISFEQPATQGSDYNLVLPISLIQEKYAILYDLTDLSLPQSILFGDHAPLPLSLDYILSAEEALLDRWMSELGANTAEVNESLARLIIAERYLSASFGDAATMSSEMSESLLYLMDAYFTTKSVIDHGFQSLDAIEDITLSSVLESVTEKIYRLSAELNLQRPASLMAAYSPSPLDHAAITSMLSMHQDVFTAIRSSANGDNASFISILAQDDVKNTIIANSDTPFLEANYIAQTQLALDEAIARTAAYDFSGNFNDAFTSVLAGENGLRAVGANKTDNAQQQSDSLQQAAAINTTLSSIELLMGSDDRLLTLKNLARESKSLSLSDNSRALGVTSRRLFDLQNEVQAGMSAAFTPNSENGTTSNSLKHFAKPNPQQVGTYLANYAVNAEAYVALLSEIASKAERNDRDGAISLIDALVVLDDTYASGLNVALTPILSAISALPPDGTSLDTSIRNLIDGANKATALRLGVFSELVHYGADTGYPVSALGLQRDSLATIFEEVESLLTSTTAQIVEIEAPVTARVADHRLSQDIVIPGVPFQVIAKIRNTSPVELDNISVSLETDSLTALLTSSSISLPSLTPDQEIELRWNLQIVQGVQSEGAYTIQLDVPLGKGLSEIGTYQVQSGILPTSNETTALPEDFALLQNYPNPFTQQTTIPYLLPQPGQVSIKLYDMLGREVANVVDEHKPAGRHQVQLEASSLSSGTYLVKFETDAHLQTKRITVIR